MRAAIISGAMAPGDVFSAPELAARFGVSATPVREGMLDLAKDGFVVVLPNKGFRVTELSDQDLDDVTGLRMIIEPAALQASAPFLAEPEFAELDALARTIVESAASGDLESYLAADVAFHLLLLSKCGNRKLLELVETLRGQARLFGLARLSAEGKLVETADEHNRLVTLVRSGDHVGARELLLRHIGHSRGVWSQP